ncbi:inositol 1,4,5-trisphosphate receptor-interacting protein-like [Protopterus annectens]|uniref:inositol 1,4,5-trisphosphate receptor-interacting protein-like n=1 Tax=Protopterus annectens TaxID=7888 RepID=UPI001CF95152|nr:inositol 1,4,5-trisphosphate receptor-interacting protein-like [Protopterus annectens]
MENSDSFFADILQALLVLYMSMVIVLIRYFVERKGKKSIYHQIGDKIDFSTSELLEHKSFAEVIVKKLLKKMQYLSVRGDPHISGNIIGIGSAFENLKIKPQIQFDFIVLFSLPFQYVSKCVIDEDDIPNAYGKILVSENWFTNLLITAWHGRQCGFLGRMCNGNYLSAKAVHERFRSLADMATDILNDEEEDINLTFLQQGPTLKIERRGAPEILVDLVPALKDDSIYLLAKIYGGQFEAGHCQDLLWTLSFSVQEKAFLEQKDLTLPKNACHKRTLQILKYLKQEKRNLETPPLWCRTLSSYHLKTLWLHQLQKTPEGQWQEKFLEERVLQLLDHLIHTLELQTLHHFFLGNTKLIKQAGSLCIPKHFLRKGLKYNLYDEIDHSIIVQSIQELMELQNNINMYTTYLLSELETNY